MTSLKEHLWISQVPDSSLYTCHGLRTPPACHNLTCLRLLFMDFGYVTNLVSRVQFIIGAIPALQGHASPMAYIILCVRFTCLVRLFVSSSLKSVFTNPNSATGATLDTGGRLILTRQGLAPCKMHQASLDAPTSA